MTFYTDMADLVTELLGPGADSFGEPITLVRPGVAGYDKATRRNVPGVPINQVMSGTLDSELTPASNADALARKYARVLYAVPVAGGVAPSQGDRILAEGEKWQVEETAHVVKQGVALVWVAGLSLA